MDITDQFEVIDDHTNPDTKTQNYKFHLAKQKELDLFQGDDLGKQVDLFASQDFLARTQAMSQLGEEEFEDEGPKDLMSSLLSSINMSMMGESQDEKTFQKYAETIKEMRIHELESRVNGSRLLLPADENELKAFNKALKSWFEATNMMERLAKKVNELKEKDQKAYLEKLHQELMKVDKQLKELNDEITNCSDYCKCFPLQDEDYLMLIYRNTSTIQALYHSGLENYILDPFVFPKELSAVQTPEHFFGLLENAHITMHRDSKDPSKSTFMINQKCQGGMVQDLVPILRLIIHVRAHTYIISQTFILSAKLLRMMDMGVEMPNEKIPSQVSTGQGYGMKTIVGGGMLGGGGVALAMGFPVTWPVVSMVSGLALMLSRDKGSIEANAKRLENIGYQIPRIIANLSLALDLIDSSQKNGYCSMF